MASKLHDSNISDWTPDQLPDLSGKTYLITGGNSGIGFEAAKMLAGAGARIVIAARNRDKASAALDRLKDAAPGDHDQLCLDLASLASVRSAAKDAKERYGALDGLINNAGIMQTPKRQTDDGFELQLGTNHLGHFLLAGLLLETVEAARGRIVTVASLAHKYGRIHFDDLMLREKYDPTTAYCQSKLANLLFSLELDRRLQAAGSPVAAIACHPGYSDTSLQSTGPSGFFNVLYKVLNPLFAQSAEKGAIPTVLAAAGREARAGGYYGPQAMREARGPVSDATVSERARNEETARRLWEKSEELVGFQWPLAPASGGQPS